MATVQQCDHVLIPTETKMQDDFKSAQAYVYLNAKYDYERVKANNSGSAGLGIGYEGFKLDYDQSTSAENFQERVRNRLTTMGFTMTESEARSYSKRELGDKQIEAWSTCMVGGYVIVTQPSIDTKRATVRVDYRPFIGVPTHKLTMTVAGGRIKDGPVKDRDMGGAFSATFIVERTNMEKKVTVVASIADLSDEMVLDFGLADQPLDMLGKTLNIARRAPRWDEPYRVWVPADIDVTAMAAPTRWVAAGTEYMTVSVQRFSITFEIAHESRYHNVGEPPPDFDGFVITGFRHDIKDVKIANTTPLTIGFTFTSREIRVNVQGLSPAGPVFVLTVEFSKEDAGGG